MPKTSIAKCTKPSDRLHGFNGYFDKNAQLQWLLKGSFGEFVGDLTSRLAAQDKESR